MNTTYTNTLCFYLARQDELMWVHYDENNRTREHTSENYGPHYVTLTVAGHTIEITLEHDRGSQSVSIGTDAPFAITVKPTKVPV